MRYLGLLALTIAPIFPTLVYTARKRKARTTDAELPAALDKVMARIHRGPVTLTAEEEIAVREVVAFMTERDEMPDHVQWAMRRLRDVERRCAV